MSSKNDDIRSVGQRRSPNLQVFQLELVCETWLMCRKVVCAVGKVFVKAISWSLCQYDLLHGDY